MKEEYKKTYTLIRLLLKIPFKLWYNPKIIGANNIPKKGALLVCANHRHVMDQCPILISTTLPTISKSLNTCSNFST